MTLAALPESVERKACPFCKSARVRIHTWNSHGEHHAVKCLNDNCGAMGPRRYDAQDALDAWNDQHWRESPPTR